MSNQSSQLASLALLLCVQCASLQAEILPTSLELVYEVRYGVIKLGNLSSRLDKTSNHYEVTNETHAVGMAAMLLGGTVKENCKFSVEGTAIIPSSYTITREGKDSFEHSVAFDNEQRRISFSNGTDVVVSEGYVIDNCSVPFAFIVGGADKFQEKSLHIVGGKKIRRFDNSSVESQLISTPLGEFDSIKIEQTRFERPDRKLLIWLAPGRSNLPLKIVEQRKSRPDTTMLLKSVQGL